METRPQPYDLLILVCTNQRPDGKQCCADGPAEALRDQLKEEVKRRGLKGRVRVSSAGCLDRCAFGPNVFVFPEGVWHSAATLDDVGEILRRHVDPLAASSPEEG